MFKKRYYLIIILFLTFILNIGNISNAQNQENLPDSTLGITCTPELMEIGQCKLNIYDTIGIRQKDNNTSVGIFMQDIILSATMFIGTIVVIAMIIAGLMFVFAGANSSLKEKATKGLTNAFIGLLLVLSSYTIIRLVQFIVKGE